MLYYADSSFLVSCYLPDSNTGRAQAYLTGNPTHLPFNDLHHLEVHNAVWLGVFRRLVTQAQGNAALHSIQEHLRSGMLYQPKLDWSSVFRKAQTLGELYSSTMGTRSLDILHVAAASLVSTTHFLSFDARQRGLAKAAELALVP